MTESTEQLFDLVRYWALKTDEAAGNLCYYATQLRKRLEEGEPVGQG